jgi:hypothetical protein
VASGSRHDPTLDDGSGPSHPSLCRPAPLETHCCIGHLPLAPHAASVCLGPGRDDGTGQAITGNARIWKSWCTFREGLDSWDTCCHEMNYLCFSNSLPVSRCRVEALSRHHSFIYNPASIVFMSGSDPTTRRLRSLPSDDRPVTTVGPSTSSPDSQGG